MIFRLVPKSVTLNDFERRNSRYIALFQWIWLTCVPTHNRVDLSRNLCTSLLYFVVRVRCRRKESSHSLSHRLMSFLFSLNWKLAVVSWHVVTIGPICGHFFQIHLQYQFVLQSGVWPGEAGGHGWVDFFKGKKWLCCDVDGKVTLFSLPEVFCGLSRAQVLRVTKRSSTSF